MRHGGSRNVTRLTSAEHAFWLILTSPLFLTYHINSSCRAKQERERASRKCASASTSNSLLHTFFDPSFRTYHASCRVVPITDPLSKHIQTHIHQHHAMTLKTAAQTPLCPKNVRISRPLCALRLSSIGLLKTEDRILVSALLPHGHALNRLREASLRGML